MVTNEELKKIQWNAQRAIDENGKGMMVTLAMDPVVVFAITSELLRMRKMQPVQENAEEVGDDRGSK
jgi:hypothetical protein